jgi:hypothetical protein
MLFASPSGRVICGRSLAMIVGSNSTGGMDICLFCVLSGRGLCDELITCTREVLPTVAHCRVRSRNLVWRGGHSPRWAAEPEKMNNNNSNNNNRAVFIVDFLEIGWENIFSLNSLLILAVVIEVIVGRWSVRERRLLFCLWLEPSWVFFNYKQFLDKRCGIGNNGWLNDDYI